MIKMSMKKAYKWIKENCKEGFDKNAVKTCLTLLQNRRVVPADKD